MSINRNLSVTQAKYRPSPKPFILIFIRGGSSLKIRFESAFYFLTKINKLRAQSHNQD